MTELRKKREEMKALLRKEMEKAREAGRPALARIMYGRTISVDAGRYDDKLDEHIAELRAA